MICFYSNIGCSESKAIFKWRKNNNNNKNQKKKPLQGQSGWHTGLCNPILAWEEMKLKGIETESLLLNIELTQKLCHKLNVSVQKLKD